MLERADDVGGTWRDNTYPGCACDVPSHLYSFSFAPNPDWSRTFSPPARDLGLPAPLRRAPRARPHIRFGHEVTGAAWDEERTLWAIDTARGAVTADVLIAGTGGLSEPSIPALPGLEDFEGTVFHSASWDHDHDLAGERVAVIGTGASAIQFVPADPAARGAAAPVPAHAAVDHAPPRPADHAPRATRVPPPATGPARDARRIYWARETFVPSGSCTPACCGPESRDRPGTPQRQVPDPELRAQADPELHDGLQAHPDLQRLLPGAGAGPTSRW